MGLPRPPPCKGRGLRHFGALGAPQGRGLFLNGIARAPAALGRGPLSRWVFWGPRRMTAGPSFAKGLLGAPLHHARAPASLSSLCGLCRMRAGTSFIVGLPWPPPHHGRPPVSLSSLWGLCRMRPRTSVALVFPGPPPHQWGASVALEPLGSLAVSARGPLSHLDCWGPRRIKVGACLALGLHG